MVSISLAVRFIVISSPTQNCEGTWNAADLILYLVAWAYLGSVYQTSLSPLKSTCLTCGSSLCLGKNHPHRMVVGMKLRSFAQTLENGYLPAKR